MTIVESNVELFALHQAQGESLDEYYKAFKAQVDTIDAHGGNVGYRGLCSTFGSSSTEEGAGQEGLRCHGQEQQEGHSEPGHEDDQGGLSDLLVHSHGRR